MKRASAASSPAAARRARSARVGDRGDERVGERRAVVDVEQPARLPVLDDLRGPERRGGDRRHAAGHRLDDHLAEALARRREHEEVRGGQQLGQLGLVVPAGEQRAGEPEALDRVGGVLALPLARVAADQDERGGLGHPRARLGERLEQQPEPLDLGEAADVEHRSGRGRARRARPRRSGRSPGRRPAASRAARRRARAARPRGGRPSSGRKTSGSKPFGHADEPRPARAPSRSAARSRPPGATTMRSRRAAHARSRARPRPAVGPARAGRARSPRASAARSRAGARRPARRARPPPPRRSAA